jgi:hypothetical protein
MATLRAVIRSSGNLDRRIVSRYWCCKCRGVFRALDRGVGTLRVLLWGRVLQRSVHVDAEDRILVGDAGVGTESWLVGLDHVLSSGGSYRDYKNSHEQRKRQ